MSTHPTLGLALALTLLLGSGAAPAPEPPTVPPTVAPTVPPAAPPQSATQTTPPQPVPIAPLLQGLGDHRHPVATDSPQAQRYFDQGLILAFGFNHREAARSFRQAQTIDPLCAMCWWGESLVLGPHINAQMDPADNPRAYEALQRALAISDRGGEREAAYIEALARRYAPEAPQDRAALDLDYAQAMGALAARFPDDPDAASLYAEALMDTMPWDYWESDGTPRPATRTLLATLESILAAHPDHPLANHLYIHAVEKVQPRLAVAAADRLRDLVPGAGHLAHMPAHIYIRVGRYADAILANERAIRADDDYVAQCHAQGLYPVAYIPHNHHFLSAAASFVGDGPKAIEAARHIRAHQDPKLMRQPGYEGTLQHFWSMPYYAGVRFGHWDEILAEPAPPADLLYPTGVWDWAMGLALVRRGDLPGAEESLKRLATLADDPELAAMRVFETNSAAEILAIAREVLAGEIALARGEREGAIARLERAVELEDALTYVEPSDWYVPARHHLGAALLAAGRPAQAESVYRRDLEIYPGNGWSLMGLGVALAAQGRTEESESTRLELSRIWVGPVLEPPTSRL
jgi:tetratricopeptide (TPR) repeat protein